MEKDDYASWRHQQKYGQKKAGSFAFPQSQSGPKMPLLKFDCFGAFDPDCGHRATAAYWLTTSFRPRETSVFYGKILWKDEAKINA